jgi:FKBP-type peptidyl-prolyl cis-trans isomerase SlyD
LQDNAMIFQEPMMGHQVVQSGLVVYITYSILDQAGNVVEQHDLPVGYVQGGNSGLLPSIESAIAGKRIGDRVEITLVPEDAFGERIPELAFTDDVDNVPPPFRQVGAQVQMTNEAGDTKTFYVTSIEDGKLTVDANHPLAGQNAICVVNIMEIREATPEELATGMAADSAPTQLH